MTHSSPSETVLSLRACQALSTSGQLTSQHLSGPSSISAHKPLRLSPYPHTAETTGNKISTCHFSAYNPSVLCSFREQGLWTCLPHQCHPPFTPFLEHHTPELLVGSHWAWHTSSYLIHTLLVVPYTGHTHLVHPPNISLGSISSVKPSLASPKAWRLPVT